MIDAEEAFVESLEEGPPEPLVDLTLTRETGNFGSSAFAAKDIPEGGCVLLEPPLLEAALESGRLSAAHSKDVSLHSTVDTGSSLFPGQVAMQNLGFLDAFEEADEAIRSAVRAVTQCSPDTGSVLQQSAARAAEWVAGLGKFALKAEDMEEVLLIGRMYAYSVGEGRQALFRCGGLIAHSCRPNCVFVATRVGDGQTFGCFKAVRPIAKGELLTAPYASEDFLAAGRAQRQHYLLCQKGFLCGCEVCASGSDPNTRLPCPRCRPRGPDGLIPEDQLTGCCAVRTAESPQEPWSSSCGLSFSDEQVRLGDELEAEGLRLSCAVFVGAPDDRAQRNALLGRALRLFGEDHYTTHMLLRGNALRAVAALKPLESIVAQLARCHQFLVDLGLPLGMMPVCGLFRAVIARAQAESKPGGAQDQVPAAWPGLVAAAALCAAFVEGADSENAKKGAICAKLCAMKRG